MVATPASLLLNTLTMKPTVQAPCIKAKENHGSKKKKKKYTTGLWDLNIPSELLQEILSHLAPKDNKRASLVCKAWCEAAVSVRKFLPLPWLFYGSEEDGEYILYDPLKSQRYKQNIPELKGHVPIYSRDGWLLMANGKKLEFFLNPFTRECINLPNKSRFFSVKCLAFSAVPTSTSCLVVSFTQLTSKRFVIATWRPGETVWTFHRFWNKSSSGKWDKCVFSNGVFYGFSNCGYVGVFDPCSATWKVLPVKPWDCPAFCQIDFSMKNVLMMEHSENIFAMPRQINNKSPVFKLNLERMLWEEKSEVCGLTVFASYPESERNKTYPLAKELLSQYCSLVNEKISHPPTSTPLSRRAAWVAPPHNNVNL